MLTRCCGCPPWATHLSFPWDMRYRAGVRSRSSHPTGCYYAAYRANAQVAWFPASACWHVFMYAGFKRIAPDQDTGMDLNEPWITALELFNVRKCS